MLKNKLKKVLYIEDDEDIAQIAMMTFEDLCGFDAKHCICGADGLKMLPKLKPDLIILDMMMPDMNGLETLKNIRKIKEFKDIPVIFMTAKMQSHEQKSYLDAGAVGVITKPFDPMSLCENINKIWKEVNAK